MYVILGLHTDAFSYDGKEEIMQVGAVGSAMYTPYIYNTNTVNRASMNKVQGIGEDLLETKTDFSGLSKQENVNPLKRGQTLDFAGVLDMQMQMGRLNAARVMSEKPAEEVTQAVTAKGASEQTPSTPTETMTPTAGIEAMVNYNPIDVFA